MDDLINQIKEGGTTVQEIVQSLQNGNSGLDSDQIALIIDAIKQGTEDTGDTSNYNNYWGNISGTEAEIEYDAAIEACNAWEKGNNHLNNAYTTMSNHPFKAMTDFDIPIGKKYVEELENSIEELLAESKKMQNASKVYAETTKKDEETTQAWSGRNTGGGSSSGGGGGGGDSDTPTTPAPPITPPPTQPVNPDNKTIFNDLDFNSLEKLIESLKNIKNNKKLDEILADDTYADDIKKALLASTFLSDDLKKILETMDSKVIRQLLQSIMKGEGEVAEVFELNEANLGIAYQYLVSVAEKNGITIKQLLTGAEYTTLLRETLSGFNAVAAEFKKWEKLTAAEYQAKLLAISDGNSIESLTDSSINIIRTFTEYLSTKSDITVEELLTNTKYAETLKTGVQDFAKASLFFGASSEYTDSGMTETISTVFKDVK